MAKLTSPYRHIGTSGVGVTLTTLKIVPAQTIDLNWTYNIGNNGSVAKYGDQYCLFSQNLGSQVQKKLVEYEPSEGKVYDFFYEEFGVSSVIKPAWPVTVRPEPTLTGYEISVHYGVPKSYQLIIPGPLYGTTARGGLNQSLSDWWQEQASRSASRYFNLEFGYYQLDRDKDLEAQILPKADLPRRFEIFASDQPTHKFYNVIQVLWEEDRNL